MAVQKTNVVEKIFVLLFTVIADGAKFIIGFIPIVDLFGLLIFGFSYIALNIYFFIKLGPRYFGGSRSGQKIANTFINGAVGMVPAIDDFIPELTIQAATMFWILDKEAEDDAKEAAKKALKQHANDNRRQQRLSRTA